MQEAEAWQACSPLSPATVSRVPPSQGQARALSCSLLPSARPPSSKVSVTVTFMDPDTHLPCSWHRPLPLDSSPSDRPQLGSRHLLYADPQVGTPVSSWPPGALTAAPPTPLNAASPGPLTSPSLRTATHCPLESLPLDCTSQPQRLPGITQPPPTSSSSWRGTCPLLSPSATQAPHAPPLRAGLWEAAQRQMHTVFICTDLACFMTNAMGH